MKQKITLSALVLISALPLASTAAQTEQPATGNASKAKSAGEYIDDAAITVKVKTKFVEDKTVKANDIKVKTYKGSVQLSGFADNPDEIDRAVRLAGEVAGVKSVQNDIRLK